MSYTAKRVGSADQNFAKMACNILFCWHLLSFWASLTLGLTLTKCKNGQYVLFFLFIITVGECNHSMPQVTKVNTKRTVLQACQAILTIFGGALPTRLAVLLIPRMPDPYKLYLVVKVTNQR